ncbi:MULTISPECIES: benzaldehyde dehydrogenase [Micromonospora]|uniref:Benzaldehyde dehydrogenase n=1 Tax=Micromonospora maris TaxID=1003110 RepID=A0A9X0LC16_9ACTN|nr:MULTISPECIES: benzaldehyde dehydrogenase [Micromonospora]AEB45044.1 aldehyde dehydrogenase [Micromonospora maris AB-18-032]KUJ44483.1 benzaldehyde dehydrogenase [Micromonospora maris]RUL92326.1 aldehyde dehydrogenase family protein [Verrucosispora sp. FIM060022]
MSLLDTGAWHGTLYSDGWVEAAGGTAAVRSPATGEEIGRVGVADATDVARAAARAAEAQRAWAATSYQERAAVLRRAGALWEQHAAEVGDWIVREAGSIPPKAGVETSTAAQECYEAAALASHPLGEIIPSAQPRLSLARRLPVGVVGVIAPFNFPLILAIRSVAPALALGNAVVLKPDLRTAVSGGLTLAAVFAEAGLPDGLLHVLPGGADTGAALVADPHVRVISFTGSTAAGRKVGEAAARHLKRAHLELGGNSALVVLDDADLDLAVSAGAWGSFLHQGQICMTTGRHLVHASLVERYVEALAEKADHLPVGDPTKEQVALGPIIDEAQRDKIHSLVTASVDAGARLAAGGRYDGLFYRPTVLADVTPATPAYAQEVFGPVAPVLSFTDLDEAAALAADTEYGLSLGILSRDVPKALALADRIPSGIVHINDQTVSDEAVAPFGGVRASGTGSRFGGAAANVEAFTETQWLTVQGDITRYPF